MTHWAEREMLNNKELIDKVLVGDEAKIESVPQFEGANIFLINELGKSSIDFDQLEMMKVQMEDKSILTSKIVN